MLSYRNAALSDSERIYKWNTDALTRSNSFNSNSFSFGEHDKWFRSKLDDPNAVFMIFTNQSIGDVGMVRIDKTYGDWLIGITIDEESRGKGFSSEMISKASEVHYADFEQTIIALIKNDNIASIKAFLKAGYKFDKNLLINDIPSSQYTYENS